MDKNFIFELIEKFSDSKLSEFLYEDRDKSKLKLGKNLDELSPVLNSNPQVPSAPTNGRNYSMTTNSVAINEEQINISETSPNLENPDHEIINSPIVGTFYRAPAPDAPPFVEVGDKINPGQKICVLEAMKLMNELEAEFACEVVAILVENGTMVEYNTPILEVKRL